MAILSAIFAAVDIRRMNSSDGALCEGLLYDLQGRLSHADMREDTVDELTRRFYVHREQASRVESTSLR